MNPEELKKMLETAVELGKEVKEHNAKLELKVAEMTANLDGQKTRYEALQKEIKDGGGAASIELKKLDDAMKELSSEISDLRSKARTVTGIAPKEVKSALREIAVKSYNSFVKDARDSGVINFANYAKTIDVEVKALGLGADNGSTAAAAVAEILSMDLIEYAREFSPILSEISMRSGLTRDYRELVLSAYPSIADGLEAVAGTDFPVTTTQTYGEVKTDVIKLMANAPITDEAMLGTTYNVYSDLVRLLGDQIAITFAAKVLYGNGTAKNGRGILSSGRVDITDGTGESFKATMGTGARSPDYFPVFPTGVSGALGADDEAIIDFVEDVIATLPTKYLAKATWKMNRKTRAKFAKVRDSNGQPVFKRSYIEGGVDRIAGFPVVLDDTLADIGANTLPIIFGDLKAAFAMSIGDINYMQLNPYKTQGLTYVEHNHEIFTIMGRSDAILVIACTANAGA